MSEKFQIINGKKVPVIDCETITTYRNKLTGQIYSSKEEADKDINNPTTVTEKEHVVTDIVVKPASLFFDLSSQ